MCSAAHYDQGCRIDWPSEQKCLETLWLSICVNHSVMVHQTQTWHNQKSIYFARTQIPRPWVTWVPRLNDWANKWLCDWVQPISILWNPPRVYSGTLPRSLDEVLTCSYRYLELDFGSLKWLTSQFWWWACLFEFLFLKHLCTKK